MGKGQRRCVHTKLILLLFWVVSLLNLLLGYVRGVIVLVLKGQPCTESWACHWNFKQPGCAWWRREQGPSKAIHAAAFPLTSQLRLGTWARSFHARIPVSPAKAAALLLCLPLPLLSLPSPPQPFLWISNTPCCWHYSKINKQPINFTWVPETREKLIWCCLLIKM